MGSPASRGGRVAWVLSVLAAAIGPGLIALGVASVMRQRGLLSEPRAVTVVVSRLSRWPLRRSLRSLGGAGFDAADRGVPLTVLAGGWERSMVVHWPIESALFLLPLEVRNL